MSHTGHRIRVTVIGGTRPEAIKLSPVIRQLKGSTDFRCRVISTGQQGGAFCDQLNELDLGADFRLDRFGVGYGLGSHLSLMLKALDDWIATERPDRLLVQGDTMSALAGAMAGYFARTPVGHIEAGLRSGDPASPWPEEANRRSIACYADLHFVPTDAAAANLVAEGFRHEAIRRTGNTGVDALNWACERLACASGTGRTGHLAGRDYLLATFHRKEALSDHAEILAGLLDAAAALELELLIVQHLNPQIAASLVDAAAGNPRVSFLEPQGYLDFIRLMKGAALIATDSGGVQEDATCLGCKVLVVRKTTERHEGLDQLTRDLVPVVRGRITEAVIRLRQSGRKAEPSDVFGDGRAAVRILAYLRAHHAGTGPCSLQASAAK